jgi:hypothetical protein
LRALRLFLFGVSATKSHLGLALVICSVYGGFIGLFSALLLAQEHAIGVWAGFDQMKMLLAFAGAQLLVQLLATLFIGPVFQATAAFAAFRHSRGKPGSVSRGVNFALSRYTRMLKAHIQTWLVILLGLQLLIPGIIYWNQLILVDSVTVFEKSKRPLQRSRQLTKGYRRTIFLMALPWFLYGLPAFVIEPQIAGVWAGLMVPYHVAVSLFLFALFAGYSRLYLERTGQHQDASEQQSRSELLAQSTGLTPEADLQ